jgi:high-affinity iron transporter
LKATFNIRRLAAVALVLALAGGFLLVLRGRGAQVAEAARPDTDGQRLVAILQYLASDYPAAVSSDDAGELAEQRSLSEEAVTTAARLPKASPFVAKIASINERVLRGQDAASVSADCGSLVDDLVATLVIARAPLAPPDISEGAHLFAENCASCHGAGGHGDGAAAASLRPRPADFFSEEVMRDLTPFKAFNVVRFGVKGTAMPSFSQLAESQRWALAFYVFGLRQAACDHAATRVSLDELANRSDDELARAFGASEVACLRRNLPPLDAPALIASAKARVERATRLAETGDAQGAESAVLDAYLQDIEPIEPWLRARDTEVVTQLEASFTTTRSALQQRDRSAHEDAVRLVALLDRAARPHGATTSVSVFWFSLLVIVREGFEAAVIIAALLAVLKKRKQRARARVVHAGWISALAVGAVVFVTGRKLLAGAMNEKLEGYLALVAAAMLLHAALWLNARSTTRRSMGALRDRTQGALDRGALALFGIAFLAMFRESFETAVFLEALSIDAPSAVVWGSLSGAALLLGLVLAVGRLGLRLPMPTLFRISTVVLVATAVVLLGQGIHSFEEVGILPSRPMPFFRLEFLGVYPDRISVLAQLALAAAPALWTALRARSSARRGGLEQATEPAE